MKTFEVWAPKATEVSLILGDRYLPMSPRGGGWWAVEADSDAANLDYSFSLDGGWSLPDPRSAWQPFGVDGPSRRVDHRSFAWNDKDFVPEALESAIFYELHVGTFSPEGSFEAVIERLDHLVELGVTHVELMPFVEFPGRWNWGYDGVDLYAPHHSYGGPLGLKRLVDACHRRGLAVIADVVYNHLGPLGNHLRRFGPYFTDRYRTPWGAAINYDDRGSIEVRRFICDNALMWLRDYHFDGLRLDAIHAIFDQSAIGILEQLATEVHRLAGELGRPKLVIAESDLNDPRILYPLSHGGAGLDAQWNEDFHHALHALLTGERQGYYQDFGAFADLAGTLTRVFVYDGRYSDFRERVHGRPVQGLAGNRFVGFAQNHDQVGNRAQGERSSRLMSRGRLKVAAALVMFAPFVPLLFQGEEWGASSPFLYFTDHPDPKLGQAVREGRRKEFAGFGWRPEDIADPQATQTFELSKLNWAELEHEPHREIYQWHRELIELRKRTPELTDGNLEKVKVAFDEAERWFACGRGRLVLAVNLGAKNRVPAWKLVGSAKEAEIVLSSEPGITLAGDDLELPPDSTAILLLRAGTAARPLETGARG